MFFKNQLKTLRETFKDPDRKSIFHISRDLVNLLIKYKNPKKVYFYFTNLMYKKNSGNIFNYVNPELLLKLRKKYFFSGGINPLLGNKISVSAYLNENRIPIANYLGKLESQNLIRPNDKKIFVPNHKVFAELIEELFLRDFNSIFIKKVNSSGGKDVFKISKENLIRISQKIDLEETYIIEETIEQHPTLSEINPYSINTIRMVTYYEKDRVIILNSFLRMGVDKNFVDNASSGGIFIGYNLLENKLDKVAYSLYKNGGKSYYKHPDTDYEFKNKRLLFSEEIKDILGRAVPLVPRKMVGWDIAITTNGPIVLEINQDPHLTMSQIAEKGLLHNFHYKNIFNTL